MIYRCPNCNGALEYNPATDEMECAHCGGSFTMQEMECGNRKAPDCAQQETAFVSVEETVLSGSTSESDAYIEENNIYAEQEFMECKIYTCTSCGAELAVNETEVSTYCAYCGQPTIVYNRVSKERKPKYIIPFKISREQALKNVREKFGKGALIPKGIKKFDVEKMRGIYIPYYLFDTYFLYVARVRTGEGVGSDKKTVVYRLEADSEFKKITCDASKRLENEVSQRLEPYKMEDLREFDAAYLSGFYADCSDLSPRQLDSALVQRCKYLFDEELKVRLADLQASVTDYKTQHNVHKVDYALLPAWFITFRYKNEPYTILVNGQTGKVVGSVPVDKGLAFGLFASISALISGILCALSVAFWDTIAASWNPKLYVFIYFFIFVFFLIGISSIHVCNQTTKLTKLVKTAKFVKERQDDN